MKTVIFLLGLLALTARGQIVVTGSSTASGSVVFNGVVTNAAPAAWTPASPTNTLSEWLDASSLSAGVIGSWPATVGMSPVSSGAARPTVVANAINGHSAVQFDGTQTYLCGPMTAIAQPFTVWVALKITDDTLVPEYIVDGTNSPAALFLRSTTEWGMYAGSVDYTGTFTIGTSSWHVLTAVFDDTSSTVEMDGGGPKAISPGANPLDGLTVGAARTLVAGFSATQIGEVFIYQGKLNPVNVSNAWYYTTNKW